MALVIGQVGGGVFANMTNVCFDSHRVQFIGHGVGGCTSQGSRHPHHAMTMPTWRPPHCTWKESKEPTLLPISNTCPQTTDTPTKLSATKPIRKRSHIYHKIISHCSRETLEYSVSLLHSQRKPMYKPVMHHSTFYLSCTPAVHSQPSQN